MSENKLYLPPFLFKGSGGFSRGLASDADTLQLGVFVTAFSPIVENNDDYLIQHISKQTKTDLTIGEVAGSVSVKLSSAQVIIRQLDE